MYSNDVTYSSVRRLLFAFSTLFSSVVTLLAKLARAPTERVFLPISLLI